MSVYVTIITIPLVPYAYASVLVVSAESRNIKKSFTIITSYK